jgi:hypothetical protein
MTSQRPMGCPSDRHSRYAEFRQARRQATREQV